ncbi:oligosaccharide repeat unit polymerase [Sutcliffiella horikoshii]|uniref:O-antigen polymerase n=1 Tax=Sutcliffiella horikoshii TaxID=79883 RepID=UPI001CBE5F57|nr:O-antigen polymerase [Sutcliffiella horikoshii]UAL47158.1 oligosaccharide repeat unit polymerase [Sutcliffiella horikoshii]
MAILTSFICLFLIMVSAIIDRRIYSPFILFNFWWGITIFISNFGFFGIYVPSEYTYFIMLVAILSFNFPLIYYLKKSSFKQQPKYINEEKQQVFSQELINNLFLKLLLVSLGIVVTILAIRSVKALQLLMSGVSYIAIRYNYFRQETIMSGYDHLINNLFVLPVIVFSIIFVSLQFFQKKYNKLVVIATILSIILYVFSSGGRSIIISFGIVFIAAYFINRKQINQIKFLKKLLMQVFIITILLSLVFVSLKRLETDGGIGGVLSTVIIYFTAPYLYFENMLPLAMNDDSIFFGGAFFGGIIDVFIFILRFVGFDINPIASYISEHNQTYITVSNEGAIYNAFPTMVYTFFYDFGYLGVILGSLMFGILSLVIYKKMLKTNNFGYKGAYIMIILMIFESPMRWIGTSTHTWVVIIMFLILSYYSKQKK